MKKIVFLLLTFTFQFCVNKNTENKIAINKGTVKIEQETAKEKENLQANIVSDFLNEFSTIEVDKLHVYSRGNDINNDPNKTPFKGKIIDIKKYRKLINKSIFDNFDLYSTDSYYLYAVGKFKINDVYTAILIRQFSEYDASLLTLYLWNNKKNEFEKGLDLSDSWGDVDFRFIKESWIFKSVDNKEIKIITRKKEGILTEEFEKEKVTDSLMATIFDGNKFLIKKKEKTKNTDLNFTLHWK